MASSESIAIPAALATAAGHHHLIRQGLSMQTGLVIETGEAREVHHFCVLAGYGAEAVNPWLAFETLEEIRIRRKLPLSAAQVQKNYIKAVGKGVLKVMSKMGISTYQRSEEHTSELQSLMRISYAVFCLKTKK